MATFTRFTACWGLSAKRARALGIAILFSSTALASHNDELPTPTAFATIQLPNLDGSPQPTPAPQLIPTPDHEEGLIIDTRTRVLEEGTWAMLHPGEHELRKRTETTSISESLAIIVPTINPTTLASSTRASSTSASTSAGSPAETASASPLPTFFDGGLSNTFTSETCPTFINDMIAAPDFQNCYPFSMLLGPGSQSFYEAEKSLVSISRVLDRSCAANVTFCADYLATVASNLTKSETCGADYNAGNPTATAAYLGLVGYQVVYSATCLKDPASQAYCFGDAITNTTSTTEAYFYFLPLNATLPGATKPSCSECLQDTMSIYHVATANRRQPIAETYGAAAVMTDEMCGSGFANTTLADAIITAGGASVKGMPPSLLLLTTALVAVASWLL